MPRKKVRKTQSGTFSRTNMLEAINKVRAGMSIRGAATATDINRQTLLRYVKRTSNLETITPDVSLTSNYSHRRVFSVELETQLKEYILDRSALGYGMTASEIRGLTLDLARANEVPIPESWVNKQRAGKDWFFSFMARNQELSARKPEQCSVARAMAFNKVNVQNYFEKLAGVLQRHGTFADGSRVFNLDETSTTTVGKISGKIISPKGQKQVHQIKSQERGINVTTCCIIGAHGFIVPPAVISPRAKFDTEMLSGAYPGTLGLASKKGWMNGVLFVSVLNHFIKCTGSTITNPTFLIVDNVEAHLTVEALTLCKENGITLFTLPPHTTHKTQPLDVGIFGPFQSAYGTAYHDWTISNPGKVCSIKNVASLVNVAMRKAFTPQNIISAFRATGICPFNRQIFSDAEFLPSRVTERLDIENGEPSSVSQDHNSQAEVIADLEITEVLPPLATGSESDSGSDEDGSVEENNNPPQPQAPKKLITPAMLKGFPKAVTSGQKRSNRRKGKCMVATDTPEKRQIEERAAEKKGKKNKKRKGRGKGRKKIKTMGKLLKKIKKLGSSAKLTPKDA